MHYKKDDGMNPVIQALLLALFVLIIAFMVGDTVDATEASARYRIIGLQSLAFQWTDELPYQELATMKWNSIDGFYEIVGIPRRLYSIVDMQTGYITEVYQADNGYYAMTYIEARGEDGHPHPNGGAYWIISDE